MGTAKYVMKNIFSQRGTQRDCDNGRMSGAPRATVATKSRSGHVTVLYTAPHAPPEVADDAYTALLQDLSAPEPSAVLFTSIVGLARTAALSGLLGFVAGGSVVALAMGCGRALAVWLIDLCVLVLYHNLEFFLTARFHPGKTSVNSFLVNQSLAYQVAMLAGWLEYWVEVALFGVAAKQRAAGMAVGLAFVLMGQAVRTAAMCQAGEGFTHLVALERRERHRLCTTGVYRYLRHPGYFGWFWWSVGTQLWLCNPLCTLAYAYAAWRFFANRIPQEEAALADFFPDEYPAYRARTYLGIPLIST